MLLNSPPLKKLGVVGQLYPPLGILYLSSYVKSKTSDFEFQAIDGYQCRFGDIVGKIKSYRPDVLGVSLLTQSASGAYEIIRQVKESLPKTFIMTGGPHATTMPEESIERAEADLVVVGEGEETFYEALTRIKQNRDYFDVVGTVSKKNGKIIHNPKRNYIMNLDEIPFPDRDLLDIKIYPGYHYKKSAWDTSYITGRGCPYECTYCSDPVWKVQKPWLRLRSPENVIEEIEYLKSKYGVREFYDQTDLFNGNIKWAKTLCKAMIDAKLNIHWKVQMTVRNIDDELAELMVKSGCWLGFLGIETGNDETLRGINKTGTAKDKKTDTETAERSLTLLKKYGMKTFALLMAFNVWEENGQLKFEDREMTMKTFRFAEELIHKKKLDIISWSMTTPYPGSPLWEIAQRHKLIPDHLSGKWENWDTSANFVMKLPGVSEKDWRDVYLYGKWLQFKLLFRSGTFNWRSLGIYMRKGFGVLRNAFGFAT